MYLFSLRATICSKIIAGGVIASLPATRSIADEVYIFQQDNAPAVRARQTVELFIHSFICSE